jgi:hypothetical protein
MNIHLNLGKFVSEDGDVLDAEPSATDAFPIRCGDWPNEYPNAIRQSCSTCGVAVGISPKGLRYHRTLPALRPLLCAVCFEMLIELLKVQRDD